MRYVHNSLFSFQVLFEISQFDNVKFSSSQKQVEEIAALNEDECAMSCLQKSFCDYFVFIRSIEPFRSSKKKNCQLATNTRENIMPCRYDSLCANLSPCKCFYFSILKIQLKTIQITKHR